MTREEWVKELIGKQPVFDKKDDAIQEAIKRNKKDDAIYEVWKEPKNRGGRYVVAEFRAFETLYREKYTQVIAYESLFDIDEIEEA